MRRRIVCLMLLSIVIATAFSSTRGGKSKIFLSPTEMGETRGSWIKGRWRYLVGDYYISPCLWDGYWWIRYFRFPYRDCCLTTPEWECNTSWVYGKQLSELYLYYLYLEDCLAINENYEIKIPINVPECRDKVMV